MVHSIEKILTPKTLRLYCTVVECGSMTAASKALGLSQPVVSSVISEMESIIGSALIDRSTRPLRLTPLGLMFYEKAQPVMLKLNELHASIAAFNSNFDRSLSIGMISSVSAGSSALIKQLYDAIGDLRIVSGMTPDLTLHLKSGEVDMILTSDNDRFDQYRKIEIFTERFVLVTPSSADYQSCDSTTALVSRFPFVGYTTRSALGLSISEYLQQTAKRLHKCLELNSPNQVIQAVSLGMGWALSPPTCVLESGVPLNALRIKPAEVSAPCRRIVLVSNKEELGEPEKKVASIVKAHVRNRTLQGFKGANSWISGCFDFESEPTSDAL
ncbi:LysR family transcriptional regulator [Achromobacter spanius]|uniref:LysR family transcriptional regulator n=1 Tax=Achromobacter spanius TaxID=217203 RepID=UPI0036E0790F